MQEWRIARAFRTTCGIYRIPHTLMTQGSMVLRETWIGHWRGTCAHGGAARLVVIRLREDDVPAVTGVKRGKPKKEPRLASGLQVWPGSFRASSCSRLADQKPMIRR
ncbi:MAG: hypothetical protein KF800_11240 [Lysobacter sp.]|nr:hypothetical protein [Lysobacter sp.]